MPNETGRSSNEFSLFGRPDRFHGGDFAAGFSIAYFDKDETMPVSHHEVDLAEPATVITGNQSKSLLEEPVEGARLGIDSYCLRVGSDHVVSRPVSALSSGMASSYRGSLPSRVLSGIATGSPP